MKCFRTAAAYNQTVTVTNANVASQGMDMIFLQQFFISQIVLPWECWINTDPCDFVSLTLTISPIEPKSCNSWSFDLFYLIKKLSTLLAFHCIWFFIIKQKYNKLIFELVLNLDLLGVMVRIPILPFSPKAALHKMPKQCISARLLGPSVPSSPLKWTLRYEHYTCRMEITEWESSRESISH